MLFKLISKIQQKIESLIGSATKRAECFVSSAEQRAQSFANSAQRKLESFGDSAERKLESVANSAEQRAESLVKSAQQKPESLGNLAAQRAKELFVKSGKKQSENDSSVTELDAESPIPTAIQYPDVDGPYIMINDRVIKLKSWCVTEDDINDKDSIKSVVIPPGITTICSGAFSGCRYLKSLVIADSVIKIESNAFYHCSDLETVRLPNSLTSIGDFAFTDCYIKTIYFPESLNEIGGSALSLMRRKKYTSCYYLSCDNHWLKAIYVPKGTREKFAKLLNNDKFLVSKIVEK